MVTARQSRTPDVEQSRTFLQIAKDFTKPLDVMREAISNALDAKGKNIWIKVWEDERMPGGELVIEVMDDGEGMTQKELDAFFDLGNSTRVELDGKRLPGFIGEKGHGTKTYYNSRQIEVFTRSGDGKTYYALMDEPLKRLLQRQLPKYEWEENPRSMPFEGYGTKVVIRGFNQNVKTDFAHRIIRDHIRWFTKFATFEWIFEGSKPATLDRSKVSQSGPKLHLYGLGHDGELETIPYGHDFPAESTGLVELRKRSKEQPMRWYVKRWWKPGLPVKEYPHVKLDVVFSLEGDLVRRGYNEMISYQGKKQEGDYTIEQRYGLWACKDYVPVKTVNEWFSAGRADWTKFHAFVNCQQFALTANRADINNTDPKLLGRIADTVREYYEEEIADSAQFQEYLAAVREEERYRNAQQEGKDFTARKKRASKKAVAVYKGTQLVAPGPAGRGERGQEMGVHCLFAEVAALNPSAFPFTVVDYDTHRGYDCLASLSSALDLSGTMAFVEFKYKLEPNFNHSFDHLRYVVCWECDLADGGEVRDLQNERRIVKIFERGGDRDHKTYFLQGMGKPHNIEVFVLRDYLKDKLGLEFKPRSVKE